MRLPLSALLAGWLALGPAAPCPSADLGGDLQAQASSTVNNYRSSDGVQVTSPQVSVQANMDQRTQVALDYDVDAVSAASFNYARSKTHSDGMHGNCKACHSAVDALSGASMNYYENRQAATLRVQRRVGEARASVQWYHSQEHDYRADALHLGLDQDLAGRDATVSFSLEHGSDRVGSSIDPGYSGSRVNNKGSLAWTQLLDPRSELRLLADYADEQGSLADPYAFVRIDSAGNTWVPIAATAPGLRERWDLGLTYKRALLPQSSLELGWRYYQDDWGVQANTLSLSWSGQWGGWILEPEYRFYAQSQANFFSNDYTQSQTYMTRDLKLAAFSSHWLGLDLRGPLGPLFAADLRYGRYMRVDQLDYSHYFADGPAQADTWQFSLSLR